VPEHPLNHVRRNAVVNESGRVRVPQVMEPQPAGLVGVPARTAP
jgi:hypothetical protein